MTTASQHARAWLLAHRCLEDSLSRIGSFKELDAGTRADISRIKTLCAAVASGYEALAQELEKEA